MRKTLGCFVVVTSHDDRSVTAASRESRNSLPPPGITESDPRTRTAMAELRFNVFGKLIAVTRTSAGWTTYLLGPDGKRTAADIVVPAFIKEEEIGQYLADLLHELAMPTNNRVVRLPSR